MEDSIIKIIRPLVKNVTIEMGQYKFSLHSYVYDLIFRNRTDGVNMDDIYEDLGRYNINRTLVFYCILYMVKKGEVEPLHTQKNYFTMRYRIKGKWNQNSS